MVMPIKIDIIPLNKNKNNLVCSNSACILSAVLILMPEFLQEHPIAPAYAS